MDLNALLPYLRKYGPGVLLFVIYIVFGYVGLQLHPVNTFATLIWPGTGIALSILFLYGRSLAPAILLGAFLVNLSIGAEFFVALGIAIGNTLEALAGVYLLRNLLGFKPSLLRVRDTIGIIFVAFVVTAISASAGVVSLLAGGHLTLETVGETWRAWWIGDMLSILTISPLLFKWLSRMNFVRTRGQYIELWASIFTVSIISLLLFWTSQKQFAYYLFIPLTWVALRAGPRGMTLAVFIATYTAITGTLAGHGAYAGEPLVYLQTFLGTISILFPVITAIVEERKMVEELLKQHSEELEYALNQVSSEDEAKKNFLAMLAHELRNPLAAILSSVELLHLTKNRDPETATLLDGIGERVRTMNFMLNDVLDISRISRNKLILQRELVSIDALLDRSIHTAQTQIRKYGHALSVTRPDRTLYIHADPIRFEQILVNLLDNAAKYTNATGRIELVVTRVDTHAMIRVSDTGIGIPKHMLGRVFEPFFQAQRGKSSSEGLGIGLSLTRQLVEMHGGSIEARSEGEGRGSHFIIRVPIIKQAAEQTTPIAVHAARGREALRRTKNKRSILIVDDNVLAANSLGKLLELRGYTTNVVYNGQDALVAAQQLYPEVIILDIGLPGIDGYEVAERILKKEEEYVPHIIALTGYGQPHDKERALKAGFELHLTKPAGVEEVEAAIKKVLQGTKK